MNEPMSDERLAEIRAAVKGYRGTSLIRLRPGSAHAHREALLAELDRLRAQLADVGEEWQIRYAIDARFNDWTEPTRHEANARGWLDDFRRNHPDGRATLMCRHRGEWRDADDTAPTAATHAGTSGEAP